MLFSSITFLYFFLPMTLLVYFLVPEKYKNGVLCLASFFFYAWGEPVYCLLLAAYIVIGFLVGRRIEALRENAQEKSRRWLVFGVVMLLGGLFYFKYLDFIWENISKLMYGKGLQIGIILPIGISFYTFQVLSYLIDVYRGKMKAEHEIVAFATYVSLFPQLIAGPIVRYETIQEQMHHRSHGIQGAAYGARRFVVGLAKKVMIADMLGEVVAELTDLSLDSSLGYWVLAIAFMLQIYYDFSGYSDMAIGLGAILGFSFPENFQYPLISKSITEFWRRWHISLSSWMRDYLYIPLGGNRVKAGRWIVNMLLVWGFSGLWHGAGWNFILWGLYFGVFLILEKKIWGAQLAKLPALVQHIYTLLVIIISFVLFRIEDIGMLAENLKGMFLWWNNSQVNPELSYQISNYAGMILAAIIGACPIASLVQRAYERITNRYVLFIWNALEIICYIALFVLSTAFLVNSSFHPFLYFRF